MEIRQGDIYWVDIPQTHTEGSEQFGRRPVIVMSRTALNRILKTVIVVPFTTFQDNVEAISHPPYRIVIPLAEITKDISCTSPLSTSVAKTDQARVIDKVRLQQKIGRLSQTAIISVGVGLAYIFDLR
jgi:mRNA interferase MazF